MGVPTSEVGYTSTMPRREDHEEKKERERKKNTATENDQNNK